jgi:N-acetylglucosaminylphosphatidylinositol deacetylase
MTVVIVIIVLTYILLSIIMAKYPDLFFDSSNQRMDGKRMRGNTLLVIAHPDDECMFFGPAIISFMRQKRGRDKFMILCLSNGDQSGGQSGEIRQQELFRAARILGLSPSDVTVTLSEHLKDGRDWSEILITNIVHQHCEKNSIRNIITFDEYGVSGHKNHISIFHAAKNVPGITLFALESVSIFRKYMSILDLPSSLMLNYVVPVKSWIEIIPFADQKIVAAALHQHVSQMVWFRRLYSYFSRFLFINTFQVYK